MQVEDDSQNINDLEKEVIELATETNVLKKSAPEANDESNIQYFLAIAELGKVIFWPKISPLDSTPLKVHSHEKVSAHLLIVSIKRHFSGAMKLPKNQRFHAFFINSYLTLLEMGLKKFLFKNFDWCRFYKNANLKMRKDGHFDKY